MARRFLFVLASTRSNGNTELLARTAAAGLEDGAEVRWLSLSDHPLPPFTDTRHDGDGVYAEPDGHAATVLAATLDATDIVIASPMYWYSVSAAAKLYLDHWTAWLRVPAIGFRDAMAGKTLWAVTAHTSDEPSQADPLIGMYERTADYMDMVWGGALLGHGNRPGDVVTDKTAVAQAGRFFTLALTGTDIR